jgi:hypothetical protein
VNLDLDAVRRLAAALDRHAAALPGPCDAVPIPPDCPVAGRAHQPYLAAAYTCDGLIRSLRAALAEAGADLLGAAGRTERADAEVADSFDRLR